MQVVILAAGMGTRLGRDLPKCLTTLADGRTILQQQLDNIRATYPGARITMVVGYRAEDIIERADDVSFVFNDEYDQTNTSKSLLRALRATGREGVLWLNGDVVFDPSVLRRSIAQVADDRSFVTVNTSSVSDEEVKYTTDRDGNIAQLSKKVVGGLGEAVGINFVASGDKQVLVQHLQRVGQQDYFERGIELAIGESGARFEPVDISDLWAVEVDFAEDLERANLFV